MQRTTEDTKQRLRIYGPEDGYDIAAGSYEGWHWSRFWKHNEAPLVKEWASKQSPGSILDAGTGTGVYRPVLERLGYCVVGVDLSSQMLRLHARKYPSAALVQASLTLLPFEGSSFDYLLCTRVLSHIQNIGCAFAEFARVTKPNARLFVADVHPEHRYSEMSIPTPTERVSIRTQKHAIADISRSIESSGFEILAFHEVHLDELAWIPPAQDFENIYADPTRPIFYICQMKRL